ncbi:MAG: TIM barrel protein [Acidimicrobiales bacterium]
MSAARVAGAPISWGVCEVPGWGHQLSRDRVLAEMRELGLTATELGPEGFLPDDPVSAAEALDSFGLEAVGGFLAVVLHDEEHDPLPEVRRAADRLAALHAGVLVLAAASDEEGYDHRRELDWGEWDVLLANLERVSEAAVASGLELVLHPHVGTVVQGSAEVRRVLGTSPVPLCIDTGHLLIGGTDPLELVREVPDRVAHVHVKDVDPTLARRVREGGMSYAEAVAKGLYRPLGQGDVDVAGVVGLLEAGGYRGWYVLEQDMVLEREPVDRAGPSGAVGISLGYLQGLLG